MTTTLYTIPDFRQTDRALEFQFSENAKTYHVKFNVNLWSEGYFLKIFNGRNQLVLGRNAVNRVNLTEGVFSVPIILNIEQRRIEVG